MLFNFDSWSKTYIIFGLGLIFEYLLTFRFIDILIKSQFFNLIDIFLNLFSCYYLISLPLFLLYSSLINIFIIATKSEKYETD